MPTVPVVLNLTDVFWNTMPSIAAGPGNNWSLQYLYREQDGVLRGNQLIRYRDGEDLSPLALSIDLASIFPESGTSHSMFSNIRDAPDDYVYLEANLTYPDTWFDVRVQLHIHCFGFVGYIMNAVPITTRGYSGTFAQSYTGPHAQSFLLQPSRVSELQPSEEPMPLHFTMDTPRGGMGPLTATTPQHADIRNYALSEASISGSVNIDYGDGALDSHNFSYTLPAATIHAPWVGEDKPDDQINGSIMKRIPVLRVTTDANITEIAAPEVISNTEFEYIAQIRVPRFLHYYDKLGNSNPHLTVATNTGKVYTRPLDPVPVANFKSLDVEFLSLDGSDSFDLTSAVVAWNWWVTGYFPDPPDFPSLGYTRYFTTTPLLELPEAEDGDYWVWLEVRAASGAFSVFSELRRKLITVEATRRFGSLIDANEVLYTAVNDGEEVQLNRFKDGTESREIISTTEDARDPSIYKDSRNHIHMGYTRRSDGVYVEVVSKDDGKVFA